MPTSKVNYQITGENLLSRVLRQIYRDADKTDEKINSIGGTGNSNKTGLIGSIVNANLLTNAIQNTGNAVFDFAKDSIRAYGQQEQFLTSLKTMFHGNADEAKFLNEQLKSFAKATPFELTEIQDATKMMIAYGSTSGSVVKEMEMLGDISSGVGAPLKDIAYLYGTLRTQGRAFSKDIYQFTGRGIPIIKELAKQFNVSESAVMGLVEKGKVGFPEVEKALKSMTETGGQFSGMMNEQSKTLNGQLSNLGDSWEQLKVNIASSQTGILKSTVSFFSTLTTELNKWVIDSNKMDEAFSNYGAKGFSLGESLKYHFLGGGDKSSIMKQQQMFNQVYDPAMESSSKIDKIKAMAGLNYQLAATQKSYGRGEIDKERADRETALLKQMISDLDGGLRMLNKTESEKLKENDKTKLGADEKLGTGVTIEAQQPKYQYVTINGGLVHDMKIESIDGDIPAGQIKEQISTILVEVLNDAYTAMR